MDGRYVHAHSLHMVTSRQPSQDPASCPMTAAAEFVSQKPLNPGAESSGLALLPLQVAAHMRPHLCLLSGNKVHSVPVNVAAMDSGRSWESDLCSEAVPGVWVVSISPK